MDGSPEAFRAFLTNLSKNPSARAAYASDPPGVMNAAGLTQDQIVAVLSQDPMKVQALLGGAGMPAAFRVRATVIIHLTIEL